MNKTILITGASSGFGAETAKLLSSKGYKLILVARRLEKLEELKEALKTPIYIASVDVRKRSEVENLFNTLPEEFKNIDLLVNNAGLAKGLSIAQEANLDDWEIMVDTNIKGLMYFTRFALEIMKKNNSGQIINIGSCSATAPYKGGNVYGATKAFVKMFTRNLRADLFGTNIRATCIEPGAAETEFSIVRFEGNEERAKSVYENTRHLTSKDIAETILWIIERPEHVNIDNLEIMPIDQTWAGLQMYRKKKIINHGIL